MVEFLFFMFLCIISNFKANNTNTTIDIDILNTSLINIHPNKLINKTNETKIDIINTIQINNNYNFSNNSEIMNSSINNLYHNYSHSNKFSVKNKKNVIIGAIANYRWEKIAPFFKSFLRAGFKNCDCVMFIEKLSPRTIYKMKSCGVIVYNIPEKYKKGSIANYRWKLYEDFLNNKKNKYNMVFTSDVRDVFFQNDVFKFYNNSKSFLGIAIEDGLLTEPRNKNWLIEFFGEDKYKTIENQKIVCSGTVWGTTDYFLHFTKKMWENLELYPDKLKDQSIANYLINYEKLFNDSLVISYNENGQVMTIGLTNRENISLDSHNNVLNGKGEIASVIHQYERKKDILSKVLDKYCPEVKDNIFYYEVIDYIDKFRFYYPIIFLGISFATFLVLFILIIICINLFKKRVKKKIIILEQSSSLNLNKS